MKMAFMEVVVIMVEEVEDMAEDIAEDMAVKLTVVGGRMAEEQGVDGIGAGSDLCPILSTPMK